MKDKSIGTLYVEKSLITDKLINDFESKGYILDKADKSEQNNFNATKYYLYITK